MSRNPDQPVSERCRWCDLSVAYLAGELGAEERGRFETHLAGCAACGDEVAALRQLIETLREVPHRTVSRDLVPGILAALPKRRAVWLAPAWFPRRVTGLAAAAAVVLSVAGTWWMWGHRDGGKREAGVVEGQAVTTPGGRAAVWLCRVQEPDGSWDTARWGGNKRFQIALTGLALMAILEEETGAPATRLQAIDRAVAYLMRQQNGEGGFGTFFDASPYNEGMATLALIKADRFISDEALHRTVDRAIKSLCVRQHADGGWGYRNESAPVSNLSITLWQVEALRLAARDWPEVRPNVGRGLRWIASVADEDGSFGYRQRRDFPEGSRTLTMMGAMSMLDATAGDMLPPVRRQAIQAQVERVAAAPDSGRDYYQSYFLAAALRKMEADAARRQLVSLRDRLMAGQVRRGPQSGSWNADDCWSATGGRIYATALASLSLR
jgi:hypothetical protein